MPPAQLRLAADYALLGPPSAPAGGHPVDTDTNNTAESITQVLQQRVTSKQQQLYNEKWSTKLPFRGTCPTSVGCMEFDDILDFCRKDHLFKGLVFRFPHDLYPPTFQGLAKLTQELVAAAKLRGGADLVSNGCSKSSNLENLTADPQPCYRLVCNCKLIFQNESNKLNKENGKVNQSIKYRKTTLHNDRLNDRARKVDGKLTHKTSTCRRKSKDDPMCPFTLPLFVDKDGFLLKIGLGNRNHQYHAKAEVNSISRVRTAILSEQQREELRDVERAHIGKSAARNMFFARHGIILSTEQIRHIARNVDTDPESGDIDEILKRFFEKENARCCFLFEKTQQLSPVTERAADTQDKISGSGFISEVHSHDSGKEEISKASDDMNLLEGEAQDMAKYVEGVRRARRVDDSQDLLLAFAWVLPEEHRQFSLYPFVAHIDGTNSTNKESRPLVTVTGRDALGHQFTVLRAFLPNNQAWVFKWLFQTVFPTLLGMDALARIAVFITDGDSQETSQLDNAILRLFPQAYRVRCIWHAVDRGMAANFPKCPVNKQTGDAHLRQLRRKYDKAELQVRHFLWSWAEPVCETFEEFRLSNCLFMMFLHSKEFADAMPNQQAVKQAIKFYRQNIFPILDHIVFYKRKHLLHFDTNSNSAHEGTNRGMKSHAAPTNPQHTLEKATKVLSHQARLKALMLHCALARKANCTTLWSDLSQLVEMAVGLINNECAEQAFYNVVGPFNNDEGAGIFWLLMRRDQESEDTQLGTVPKFKRVRKVRRCTERGTLLCDCCYFDRVGIPCRHIIALLHHVLGDEFKDITADDVRVFWRTSYIFHGMQNHNEMQMHNEMRSLLMELRDNDTQGPVLPRDKVPATIFMDDNLPIVKTYKLPLTERCMNYSPNHCQHALELYGNTSCPSNHGLSQEAYDYSIHDDFDTGDICDVFDYPSPQKKQKTGKRVQAYEVLNPHAAQLYALLDDAAADEQTIAVFKEKFAEMIAQATEMLTVRLPEPKGRTVSSAAPTSKRLKTHGTQHYSKHKRK